MFIWADVSLHSNLPSHLHGSGATECAEKIIFSPGMKSYCVTCCSKIKKLLLLSLQSQCNKQHCVLLQEQATSFVSVTFKSAVCRSLFHACLLGFEPSLS